MSTWQDVTRGADIVNNDDFDRTIRSARHVVERKIGSEEAEVVVRLADQRDEAMRLLVERAKRLPVGDGRMNIWRWLRDFADRRIGPNKKPEREQPPPQPKPPDPPPPDDIIASLLGLTKSAYVVTSVTTTCATCGAKNRVDLSRAGAVRCGKCGLPLRVTVRR